MTDRGRKGSGARPNRSAAATEPNCQQLIDSFTEPFVIVDRNYHIIAANERYSTHYGAEPGNIVGRCCYEISHRSDRPCAEHGEHCPLDELFRTGETTQVMHVHIDGEGREERVQITATPLFDDGGRLEFMGESIALVETSQCDDIIVGSSRALLSVVSQLQRVASTRTSVLLLGESGVGKEAAAQYVHQQSGRASKPLVVVDCGTLSEQLIASELFGHEKGAFTGATSAKTGLFEMADGGTLFIDEVCELPIGLQTKLLRVLETGTFRRVGGNDYRTVDVRVVAATNRDPAEMVRLGRFRQDLYYRLSAFPVEIPPLRERLDDVPLLADYFLRRLDGGPALLPLSPAVVAQLLSYHYPGNVRELRNILERALILAAGEPLTPHCLVFEARDADRFCASQSERLPHGAPRENQRLEEGRILAALEECGGHRARAAGKLGVSERTLYRHLKKMRV